MKSYRNFVLINNKGLLATTFYANCNKAISIDVYNNDSTVYMLKLINDHLKNINQWKEDGVAINVYYLLIPPKLCKLIKNKIYKTLMTSNKISVAEKLAWKHFDSLYKAVFSSIVFKPNNIYESNNYNKAYKHIVYTKKTIDKMYKLLDSNKEESSIIYNY